MFRYSKKAGSAITLFLVCNPSGPWALQADRGYGWVGPASRGSCRRGALPGLGQAPLGLATRARPAPAESSPKQARTAKAFFGRTGVPTAFQMVLMALY